MFCIKRADERQSASFIIEYLRFLSSSPSAGVRCSHKLGNDERVSGITVSSGIEEMPSQNMPIQRLTAEFLPLDLPCSGLVTHSGGILPTDQFPKKKPEGRNQGRQLQRLLDV
jgi:hypothetical protein